jgi:hypothetical protein
MLHVERLMLRSQAGKIISFDSPYRPRRYVSERCGVDQSEMPLLHASTAAIRPIEKYGLFKISEGAIVFEHIHPRQRLWRASVERHSAVRLVCAARRPSARQVFGTAEVCV